MLKFDFLVTSPGKELRQRGGNKKGRIFPVCSTKQNQTKKLIFFNNLQNKPLNKYLIIILLIFIIYL